MNENVEHNIGLFAALNAIAYSKIVTIQEIN